MLELRKVALMSDTSTSVGYETALALARNGYATYAGTKAPAQAKQLSHIADTEKLSLQLIKLDVNSSSPVTNAVKHVLKIEGLIDLLVNGSGYVHLVVSRIFLLRKWQHNLKQIFTSPEC